MPVTVWVPVQTVEWTHVTGMEHWTGLLEWLFSYILYTTYQTKCAQLLLPGKYVGMCVYLFVCLPPRLLITIQVK